MLISVWTYLHATCRTFDRGGGKRGDGKLTSRMGKWGVRIMEWHRKNEDNFAWRNPNHCAWSIDSAKKSYVEVLDMISTNFGFCKVYAIFGVIDQSWMNLSGRWLLRLFHLQKRSHCRWGYASAGFSVKDALAVALSYLIDRLVFREHGCADWHLSRLFTSGPLF